eukprot:gene15481-15625_t
MLFQILALSGFIAMILAAGLNHSALADSSTTSVAISAPSSANFGNAVTLETTVTPSSPTDSPSGSIKVLFAGMQVFQASVSGSWTMSSTLTSAMISSALATNMDGSYSISVYYYNASGSLVTQTSTSIYLSKLSNTLSIMGPATNPSVGESVTVSVSINSLGTSTPISTATGTVTLFDGSATLGTINLSGGTGSLAVAFTSAGAHLIVASYAGDTLLEASTSSVNIAVGQIVTSFSTLLSNVSVDHGASVTFSTSSLPADATGWVAFFLPTSNGVTDFSGGSCAVKAVAGVASCSLTIDSSYETGTHYIQTYYYGDNYNKSASAASVPITLNKASTSMTINAPVTSTSVTYGTTFNISALITPPPTPGETVAFIAKSTSSGVETALGNGVIDSSGNVSLAVPAGVLTTVGAYTLTGTYAGDSKYGGGTGSSTFSLAAATATIIVTGNSSTGSGSTAAYGTAVTLTATLSQAAASGTITFYDGTTVLGTGAISNGKASFSAAGLSVGSHTITATYPGDSNYVAGTVTALTFQIAPASSSSLVLSYPSGTSLIVGQTLSLTAGGLANAATGTVTFYEDGAAIGTATVASGGASFTTSALTAGPHTFSAAYSGDVDYLANTVSIDVMVKMTISSFTLSSSLGTTSTVGDTPSLTASDLANAATGTVTFYEDGVAIGTATVASGKASLMTPALTAGSHIFSATYSGDSAYQTTTAALTVTVKIAISGFALALPVNAVPTSGQTLNLIAGGLANAATGTVTFYEDSVAIGTATVASGGASFTTSALMAGPHMFSATYNGDLNYLASSASLSVVVKMIPPSFTLSSSLGTISTVGDKPSLTVSGLTVTATGTVTFYEDGVAIGTANVTGGKASFTTPALTAGSHIFSATYGGDSNYTTITSTLAVTVKIAISGFTLALPPNTVPTSGQTLNLIASELASAATGTITLSEGGTPISTSSVSKGGATLATGVLTAGSHIYTATYNGDGTYQTSTATLTVTVKVATTISVTLSSATTIYGKSVTVKASVVASSAVASSTPALSGNVTFMDNGKTIKIMALGSDGTISFSSTTFSLGKHDISATYAGNDYYLGSYVDPTLTVVHTDPTLDAAVRGLFVAQVAATQHVAQITQSTVNGRLETIHDDDVPAFSNGLAFSGSTDTSKPGQPDSFLGIAQTSDENFIAKIGSFYRNKVNGLPSYSPAVKHTVRPDYNVWTAGAIIFGNTSLSGQAARSTFSLSGVTLGIDRRLTSSFKAGVAIGISAETANISSGGASNKTQALTSSLYGSYRMGNSLYLDGQIGYGAARFTTNRTDSNAGTQMSGHRAGNLLIGSFTLSSEQKFHKLKFAPYVRVNLMKAVLKAYSEKGDADWTLAYDKASVSSTALVLGIRGQYDFELDSGIVSPTLRAEYHYDLIGQSIQNLNYVSDSSASYSVTSNAAKKSGLMIAAGLKAVNSAQLSGSIEYGVTANDNGIQGQSGAIMLTVNPTRPLRLLVLPHVSTRARRNVAFGNSPPDVVVLKDYSGWAQVHNHLSPARAAIVPVIDISGQCPGADAQAADFTAESLAKALQSIAPVLQNMTDLPAGFFTRDEPLRWLLARLAVRERPLEPDMRRHLLIWGWWSGGFMSGLKYVHNANPPVCMFDSGVFVRPLNGGAPVVRGAISEQGSYDGLADISAYAYDLTERGREAAFSADDLSSFMPGAKARASFLEQMRWIISEGRQSNDGLLQIRGNGSEKNLQSRISLHRLIYERLLPLAVPHIFDDCVIVQFPNQSRDLRGALPHLRDILADIELDLQFILISPKDILAFAESQSLFMLDLFHHPWLHELLASYGPWAVMVVVMLESMGVPLPGETMVVSAALYAGATGRVSIYWIVLAASSGAIVGDNLGYWIGRELGLPLLVKYGPRVNLTEGRLRLGQYLFRRFGGSIVFFGRFVALLRTFAALLAGANHFSWERFLVFNALGEF